MKNLKELRNNKLEIFNSQKSQYLGLSSLLTVLTSILYISDKFIFQKYMGKLNPLITVPVIATLGFFSLSFLVSKKWLPNQKEKNSKYLLYSSIITVILASVMVLIDLNKIVFSQNINILFPKSLLFYPVIGFVAEVIFHILPFTLLVLIIGYFLKKLNKNKIIWFSILIVSLIEPIFQLANMDSGQQYSFWLFGYIGIHICLFNLLQLYTLKRNGFIAMYLLRMIYYLIWHILWGYMRLNILF